MNILISCDDNYIKYTSVLLESLFENNDVPFNVYLIYKNTQTDAYKLLKKFVEKNWQHNLILCDVDHLDLSTLQTSHHFPVECYYTLFPQLYLPENVDRILYLDVDTIVDRNLEDFYNSDFEDNYLIACGQKYQFDKRDITKEPGKFGYFNSGVVLYNVEKMRKEISLDFYDFVLSHSNEFFFDQGMLNHLFYLQTKYAETLLYNFRAYIGFRHYHDMALKMANNREIYIYHYTCNGTPYKPWDLWIEEDGFFEEFSPSPFESEYYYISKEVNTLMGIWWKYAFRTPFFHMLYTEMKAKRDYILKYKMADRINLLTQKLVKRNKEKERLTKKLGARTFRTERIKKYQDENDTYYLTALNNIYGIKEKIYDNTLQEITEIGKYFDAFRKNENYLMIISCKDTCEKYFKEFMDLSNFELKKPELRESYIAVISPQGIKKETLGKEEILCCFNYGKDDLCRGTVISLGYDHERKISISEIIINSIDYSMNMIGLNIVVLDISNNSVVDTFNVNTHGDKDLTIRRGI